MVLPYEFLFDLQLQPEEIFTENCNLKILHFLLCNLQLFHFPPMFSVFSPNLLVSFLTGILVYQKINAFAEIFL